MKIGCFCFTSKGYNLALKIKTGFEELIVFQKGDYENLGQKVGEVFKSCEAILFISSTGIAVRLVAPFLRSKAEDPAVVVVDDMGRFSISLVSGHLGGANELALSIANLIGAEPVITTASDGRGIEAVDMYAKANGLMIESMESAKQLTAMMLEGKKIAVESEINIRGLKYDNLADIDECDGAIIISAKEKIDMNKPFCVLRPKIINIGTGCRRGKEKEAIIELIDEVLHKNDLSAKCIKSIATIDIKKDEEGLIAAAKHYGAEMLIFSKEEIEAVQDRFNKSQFVKEKVGVTAVAEPAAYLAGGELIGGREAKNGVTAAVSKVKDVF